MSFNAFCTAAESPQMTLLWPDTFFAPKMQRVATSSTVNTDILSGNLLPSLVWRPGMPPENATPHYHELLTHLCQ